MTFLPVVERELRVAARRRAVFWVRFASATIAVLLGGGILWFEGEARGPAGAGRLLFEQLSALAFFLCLGSGPIFTSDVLSEERREGTLGLLFLTDLRGYDVVAGKVAAASVNALMSLLATLPVLALPLLLGGVSLVDFGRMALALLSTLFLSLACGMAISAACQEARSAFALTVFVLFLLAGCLPWLADEFGPSNPVGLWAGGNPTWMLELSNPGTNTRGVGPGGFWWAVGMSNLYSLLTFAGAAVLTSRSWREIRPLRSKPSWQQFWHNLNFGSPDSRRHFRARMLDRNPILWLGSRNRLKLVGLWTFVSFALGLWIAWRWNAGPSADNWSSTFFIAQLLQAPLKWLMASEASQRWVNERQSGGLELLLTTPLSVAEILRGHGRSLVRLFAVPSAALVIVELLTLAAGTGFGGPRIEVGTMVVVGAIIFVWDLYALAWVGLWLGLSKRKANQAFLGAAVRIIIIPWIACFVVLFITGIQSPLGFPIVWFVVCACSNLLFQGWAKSSLRALLRDFAAGGASPGRVAAS